MSFWIASEGRALPAEMRGPRLMQQLRERAAKIVQHLTVEEVSGADGVDVIKKTIEASPIIKITWTRRRWTRGVRSFFDSNGFLRSPLRAFSIGPRSTARRTSRPQSTRWARSSILDTYWMRRDSRSETLR